jgi:large subunit ribosomal protein L32
MANPTSKHTRARRDKRRANWKITVPQITTCPDCGESQLPHRACPSCGMYKGRKIVPIKEKTIT